MPKDAIGVIDSRCAYTTKALGKLAISRKTLMEFRKETGIKPVMIGHTHWYRGGDLIDWMFSDRTEGAT